MDLVPNLDFLPIDFDLEDLGHLGLVLRLPLSAVRRRRALLRDLLGEVLALLFRASERREGVGLATGFLLLVRLLETRERSRLVRALLELGGGRRPQGAGLEEESVRSCGEKKSGELASGKGGESQGAYA